MSDAVLKANIVSLSKYNSIAVQSLVKLDFAQNENVYSEKAKNGLDTLALSKDGKKYLLHSKYDPILEAQRLVKEIDEKKDSLIIVYGLGLGYHLFELLKKISKDTRVIIVEHNINVLKYSLMNVDFTTIFDSAQFYLVFGDEKQAGELVLYQVGLNFYNMAYNIQFVVLPNYYIYASENKWIMNRISERLMSSILSYGNALDDTLVGFRNNYLNVEAIIESNSIEEVRGKYKNLPAIIVASGPSLDKNIHYLKSAYGKALIIACDASMRACDKHGIQPDAVASIERDEPTYTYYYEGRNFPKDVVLVGPGLLWPKIYEEYQGKKIIMSKSFDGLENWWFSHFSNIEFVNQGQSSATVAFAVAREAGCNPIILIGQDLAYSDGKKHSDLTHTEYEGANDDRTSDDVYLEDYHGNLLRSHWVYKMFKEWYEYQILLYPEINVIDATEGGAYIRGSNILSLQEAINKYCKVNLECQLHDYLNEVTVSEDYKIKKYKELICSIDKEITALNKVKKAAAKHYKRLNEIEQKIDFNKCRNDQLENILIKMQPGDKIIQYILNSDKSLQSFYKPIIIQTIMHVKKIGNVLNVENVKRNHLLQKNLMYILDSSTDLIIKEFEDMKNFISNKK